MRILQKKTAYIYIYIYVYMLYIYIYIYIYIYSKLTNKTKVIIQQLEMCKKITVVARKLN